MADNFAIGSYNHVRIAPRLVQMRSVGVAFQLPFRRQLASLHFQNQSFEIGVNDERHFSLLFVIFVGQDVFALFRHHNQRRPSLDAVSVLFVRLQVIY